MFIMTRYDHGAASYAPLYIHSFRLVAPHKFTDAEKFNLRYTAPSQIGSTPDLLRWHRYQKGLLQKDVAARVGIDRVTYCHYEEGLYEYYPIEIMRKIAALFEVPVTELLDEYNLFLYYGQGEQIRNKRRLRNMSVNEYALRLGICGSVLGKWERNQVRITKRSWELLRDRG